MRNTALEEWSSLLKQVLMEERLSVDQSGLTCHQRMWIRSSLEIPDEDHATVFKVPVGVIRRIRRIT